MSSYREGPSLPKMTRHGKSLAVAALLSRVTMDHKIWAAVEAACRSVVDDSSPIYAASRAAGLMPEGSSDFDKGLAYGMAFALAAAEDGDDYRHNKN